MGVTVLGAFRTGIVLGRSDRFLFVQSLWRPTFGVFPCQYQRAAMTLLPIGGSLYAMRAKIGVITALLGVAPNKTKFTSRIRWTVVIVWLACKSWYNSETFPRVTIKDPKACQIGGQVTHLGYRHFLCNLNY